MIRFRITIARLVALAFGLSFAFAHAARGEDQDALYQRLGAQQGIGKIVDAFIPIVLADPRINEFFKQTDTKKLATLLAEQFCQISGGPCRYSGRDMVATHAGMGVKLAHFNALAEDLQIAMENLQVDGAAANGLVARLAPMHRAIVR